MNRISHLPGCFANLICANSIPRFALCEASKYFFYLRYETGGQLYKPSTRDFKLVLQEVSEAERERLRVIWAYWEYDKTVGIMDVEDDELHPDHRI